MCFLMISMLHCKKSVWAFEGLSELNIEDISANRDRKIIYMHEK